ncbi:MAG: serine--tRNA ligase [Cytophagales bacterium]|nr:MAG: serine--tRNA ligase [Cytophagales bacterium]TAF62329.1 MAG: serine--tRNA ligase [Cytophagales bacterium]
MLQVAVIRQEKERVIKALNKKRLFHADQLIDKVLRIDDERKAVQNNLNALQTEANEAAKLIPNLMKNGEKEAAEQLKSRSIELKSQIKNLDEQLSGLDQQLTQALYELPNLPHESVPEGKTPDDNEVLLSKGSIPKFDFKAAPHWDLIKKYDIIDFELGNKITGAGFPIYKGKGARLVRALINFFLDQATNAGYLEVQAPLLVNEASAYGTGQLPDKEGQMYHATADNYYLIPTAEVPITNLYRDVIIDERELPIKNVGYTPCFRREAGSWGAHVRGLNRLHQFDKVEIVQIAHPSNSYKLHEEMCAHIAALLESLELPYRILRLCGGDISFNAALCHDFEVFSAAQERWLEVSSCSNFETFQANRLKLRIKDKQNNKVLAHTLNGSALALPRILAAILENNQTANQGIRIPSVLVPYCGFEYIN